MPEGGLDGYQSSSRGRPNERTRRPYHERIPCGPTQSALPRGARVGGLAGAAQSSPGPAAAAATDDRCSGNQYRGPAADAQPARLAKAALALGGAADEVDRRRHRAELGHVLRLWSVSHNGLRHGDRALSLPGRNSPAVREAFDDLEPFFTRMCAAVARLIGNDALRRPDDDAAHEDLATILENEGEYLARMDRIVGLFEGETRARVDRSDHVAGPSRVWLARRHRAGTSQDGPPGCGRRRRLARHRQGQVC